MPEQQTNEIDAEKNKKTNFWRKRALGAMSIMRQSKKTGLLPRSEGWSSVLEHELAESEAVDVLGEKLGLSDKERANLRTAALLHDIFKRKEIEGARRDGVSAFDEVGELQSKWIKDQGYSQEIVDMVGSIGHTSFDDFLNNYENISLPRKIMQYVDSITLGSEIVSLEQRMAYLENKAEYKELLKKGIEKYGKPLHKVQEEINIRIEKDLAPKLGVDDPSAIPEFIKGCIDKRIEEDK